MKAFLLRFAPVRTAVYWRDYYRSMLGLTFRKEATLRRRFIRKCGYEPDFQNPVTYNEKLQWLKLYWRDPLAERCADKIAVREYVAEKGYADALTPLLCVYSSANDIDFSRLPDRFALKGAHGSGMNVLCPDKSKLDCRDALSKCRRWLRVNYYYNTGEWVYRGLPRRILCERFIDTDDGNPPKDYKIYCFSGKPMCVMVASGRNEGRLCMDFFTPEWERMPFTRHNPNSPNAPEKPETLDRMLSMAAALSAPFPHARVDLYSEKGKIWFGEITFFPATGMSPFSPKKYDELFGEWLKLPEKAGEEKP